VTCPEAGAFVYGTNAVLETNMSWNILGYEYLQCKYSTTEYYFSIEIEKSLVHSLKKSRLTFRLAYGTLIKPL
jgi:hypothetical protein